MPLDAPMMTTVVPSRSAIAPSLSHLQDRGAGVHHRPGFPPGTWRPRMVHHRYPWERISPVLLRPEVASGRPDQARSRSEFPRVRLGLGRSVSLQGQRNSGRECRHVRTTSAVRTSRERSEGRADRGTEGPHKAISTHSGWVRPPSIAISTHPRSVPPPVRCGGDPRLQRDYNSRRSPANVDDGRESMCSSERISANPG